MLLYCADTRLTQGIGFSMQICFQEPFGFIMVGLSMVATSTFKNGFLKFVFKKYKL